MLKLTSSLICLLLLVLPQAQVYLSLDQWKKQELMMAAGLYFNQVQTNQAPAPFGKYTESVNGVPLEMVRVPAGSFLMGNDRSPNPEEKPAHLVNVRSFFIGQYEITRQQ